MITQSGLITAAIIALMLGASVAAYAQEEHSNGDQGARGTGLYGFPGGGKGEETMPDLKDDGRQPGFGTLQAPGQQDDVIAPLNASDDDHDNGKHNGQNKD